MRDGAYIPHTLGMNTRASLLDRVRAFLTETGMSARAFGVAAVGDHKFLRRLESGAGITLTVIEKAEAYMAEHGPADPETSPTAADTEKAA